MSLKSKDLLGIKELDPEDIEIYDEDDYFTIIKLKLK